MTQWSWLFNDEAADILRKLYVDQGLSLKQMGARWGCNHQTIRRALEHHGIARRPARKPGGPEVFAGLEQQLRDLYAYGFTLTEIATRYGLRHYKTVERAFWHFGIPRRRPGRRLGHRTVLVDQEHEIRDLHRYGYSQRELAEVYQVNVGTIAAIVHGSWRRKPAGDA